MIAMHSKLSHLSGVIHQRFSADAASKIAVEINHYISGFTSFFLHDWAVRESLPQPKKSRPGTIYFMQDTLSGDIKIGFSDGRVWSRAKAHGAKGQRVITTLLELKGEYRNETDFHEIYAAHRIKGEWYHGNPVVMDSIKAMARESENAPDFSIDDALIVAGWKLFFWDKEADCYKKILERFAGALMIGHKESE